MYKQILEKLKAHKAANRLTWKEISEDSGISYSMLTKLACGERDNPTAKIVDLMIKYLEAVEEPEAA